MNNNISDYEKFLISNGYLKRCITPEDNYNYSNNMKMNQTKFVNPEEGFLKGNLQAGTYIPYKNMPVLMPKIDNEKDALLEQVQTYSFAAHDVNLFLDTHPEDKEAIELFNRYNTEADRLTKQYVSKYGPVTIVENEGLNKYPWAWEQKPWPWNNN